jgi:hypothetical protein
MRITVLYIDKTINFMSLSLQKLMGQIHCFVHVITLPSLPQPPLAFLILPFLFPSIINGDLGVSHPEIFFKKHARR